MKPHDQDTMTLLREQIARIERRHGAQGTAARLSTGFAAIDAHLEGGLPRGTVHEVCGSGDDQAVAVRPASFIAWILGRHTGQIVWLSSRRLDLHAAGLRGAGLSPGRLICVETGPDNLAGLCEDVLREKDLLAMVADLDAPLTLTASRRLQLAAEKGGVTGFLLHRQATRGKDMLPPPSACQTRWRIGSCPSVLPSHPSFRSPVPGPARWRIELLRQRGGLPGEWRLESPVHAPHPVPLAPLLANGSLAPPASGPLRLIGAGAARV